MDNELTLEEIAKHNTDTDAWIIYKGKVYDVTDYVKKHPGGEPIIRKYYGKDCTLAYDKFHSYVNIDKIIGDKKVGVVKKGKTSNSLFVNQI